MTGAYLASTCTITSETPVFGFAVIFLTRPTETPEIRTSASCASWPASRKGIVYW